MAVDTERGLAGAGAPRCGQKEHRDAGRGTERDGGEGAAGQGGHDGRHFTITNLGGIGGTGFTPIVNWPEVAILGMLRSRWQPVVRSGQVVTRLLLPLSLSYDHRVIDGAAAARFMRLLAEMLENPWLLLLKS